MLQTMSRRYHYRRMTPAQFSQALNEIGITMRQFARLSGLSFQKVERFLNGQESDIPHHVAVLCALMKRPGALDVAKTVTDMLIEEKDHD